MQRPYPPMYNTPQSNSPASVTSPQSHDHGRPMYGQPGAGLSQPLYGYPQYQPLGQVHQPTYGGHHPQSQQHQLNTQPMLPYSSSNSQLSQGPVGSHHSTISSSPRLKSEVSQAYQQSAQPRPGMMTPQSHTQSQPPPQHASSTPQSAALQQQHQQHPQQPQAPQHHQQQPQQQSSPGVAPNSNAAPGPIPATTPLVVRQDGNGVQWIAFEYSRDRVKMEYTIRCDVESVNPDNLSQEFKSENCVYPRACVPKEQYKGNRLAYETDCNQVGWALAELNACLRGKRGLIQRAVDSWRNSNQDPRLRSRRVRRQAKINTRTKMPPSSASQGSASTSALSTGLPGPNSMAAPSARPPGTLSNPPAQILHHHQDISPTGQDNIAGTSTLPDQAESPPRAHNDLKPLTRFPNFPLVPY